MCIDYLDAFFHASIKVWKQIIIVFEFRNSFIHGIRLM